MAQDPRIQHLLRRAGFGATAAEAASYSARGYSASLAEILDFARVADDVDARFAATGAFSPSTVINDARQRWLYRMVHSRRPLQEKMALFWHNHFATAYSKVAGRIGGPQAARVMASTRAEHPAGLPGQVELFREYALPNFRDLLFEVAKDPAMLVWLDGRSNSKARPQENFAREIMERFTIGVGQFTEADVYAGARVFTGWNLQRIGDREDPNAFSAPIRPAFSAATSAAARLISSSRSNISCCMLRIESFLLAAILCGIGLPSAAAAQERAAELGPALLRSPAVQSAVDFVRADEMRTIADQIRICEVEAPPFQEAQRAQLYAQMFREAGLKNVRIDAEGNVIGDRPGAAPRPNLVMSAHLDTVFPKGTNVKVRRQGYILRGPGIGDDCRGLADLLAVARALNHTGVTTPGTITFVGTVGEEGLGDLRGVKRLFGETLKDRIDRFVSIDGGGLGITHVAIGSTRFRVTFKGPGGHSFGSFGTVNPVHALGRAVDRISEFRVPLSPRTTFNVGRIGGGTSINTIASEAWMEVDLRSGEASALIALEKAFREAVQEAVAEENTRWNSRALSVTIDTVGRRPAGRLPASAPIVQAAVSVSQALNLPLSFAEGSTDANLPLSLGIPALTIDSGGRGEGAHTESELYDATDAWKGTQRALLLAVVLAQP